MATATYAGTTTSYTYDADGQRVQSSSPAGKRYFVRTGGQLLAEYSALVTKLSPQSGSAGSNTTVTVTWSGIPGATYAVCWDTSNNLTCNATWQSTGTTSSRTLTNLTPGTTYYWQVRATTANGTAEADSGTWWSVTVVTGGFMKLGPANGLQGVGSTVTLQWNSIPDSGYWLCWDQTNNNSCDGSWWPNGGSTSRLLQDLTPGTYYWQARVQTPNGTFDADAGTWWSFTVGGAGGGFTKLSPAPGISGLASDVTVQWSEVPNEGYSVCRDTSDNGVCDTTWWPNGGATSKLLQNLTPGTTYYWQVKATNGVEANSGVWWSFSVGTPVITFGKQTPAAGAILTANAATLSWTTAQGASFYEVCLDTVNNGTCDTQWQPAAQATVKTIAGLTDGTYYWQVRAQIGGGTTQADAGAWWAITVDAPEPVREYIYLGSTLLAEYTLVNGTAVLTYYHTDALGSVRAVTPASGGSPLVRHDYFPFGESTSFLTGDPRRFTGAELDSETGFHYLGARYYRNVFGRFTSADDPGYMNVFQPQSMNRYAYVLNNPLRYVDPTGHQGKCVYYEKIFINGDPVTVQMECSVSSIPLEFSALNDTRNGKEGPGPTSDPKQAWLCTLDAAANTIATGLFPPYAIARTVLSLANVNIHPFQSVFGDKSVVTAGPTGPSAVAGVASANWTWQQELFENQGGQDRIDRLEELMGRVRSGPANTTKYGPELKSLQKLSKSVSFASKITSALGVVSGAYDAIMCWSRQ